MKKTTVHLTLMMIQNGGLRCMTIPQEQFERMHWWPKYQRLYGKYMILCRYPPELSANLVKQAVYHHISVEQSLKYTS